jgi:hypothetical protein
MKVLFWQKNYNFVKKPIAVENSWNWNNFRSRDPILENNGLPFSIKKSLFVKKIACHDFRELGPSPVLK